ncbi:MAG: Lrp/AsnC family transcriptional regulator [Pseudomonadota bacterium]
MSLCVARAMRCKPGTPVKVADASVLMGARSELYETLGHYGVLVELYNLKSEAVGRSTNVPLRDIPLIERPRPTLTFRAH